MKLITLLGKVQRAYGQNISPQTLVENFDSLQKSIFVDDTFQYEFVNPTDPESELPHINTISGQTTYSIEAGVLRGSDDQIIELRKHGVIVQTSEVLGVYTASNIASVGYTSHTPYGYLGQLDYPHQGRNLDHLEVPVKIESRSNDIAPTITLSCDPGDDEKLYVRFSVKPPTVTNINSPVLIDLDRHHLKLVDGIVGMMQREIRDDSKKYDLWMTKHIQAIRGYYNRGMEQMRDMSVKKTVI